MSEPEGPDWALASEGPLVDRPVFGYAPAGNLPQSRLIQSFGVEKDFEIATLYPEAETPPTPPETANANTASAHIEATPNTEQEYAGSVSPTQTSRVNPLYLESHDFGESDGDSQDTLHSQGSGQNGQPNIFLQLPLLPLLVSTQP